MQAIPYLCGWAPAPVLIDEEIKQLEEEGRDPDAIKTIVGNLDLAQADQATLSDLWQRLQDAPQRKDFEFVEPSGLEEIRAERAKASRTTGIPYPENELYQRMLGAWLGRCCGCALGKPVEHFMDAKNGLSSKERVKAYLQSVSSAEYPLRDYFPPPIPGKSPGLGCPPSQRGNIKFMETDDDIRYTVLAQKVMLEKGAAFTSTDVMTAWIGELPYALVCTAETQAYRNYVLRYRVHWNLPSAVDWSWVATFQNPYREWIGAQIRADSWGYAAPGNPELAAEFAWRDARMSHVKNGIYGEMFVAAMIAAAFTSTDPLAVVRAGLNEIPQRSRLHVEMEQVIAICQKHDGKAEAFEKVLDEVYALLGHYHPVHTNNNAALVVAGLLLSQADFEKAITIAVMGGWDTDCNGATVGSIFGAMHGAEKIPAKWKAPLNDTLYSQITDYHPIAISECARRSVTIAQKILQAG